MEVKTYQSTKMPQIWSRMDQDRSTWALKQLISAHRADFRAILRLFPLILPLIYRLGRSTFNICCNSCRVCYQLSTSTVAEFTNNFFVEPYRCRGDRCTPLSTPQSHHTSGDKDMSSDPPPSRVPSFFAR